MVRFPGFNQQEKRMKLPLVVDSSSLVFSGLDHLYCLNGPWQMVNSN